jgi:hypothetical protein
MLTSPNRLGAIAFGLVSIRTHEHSDDRCAPQDQAHLKQLALRLKVMES